MSARVRVLVFGFALVTIVGACASSDPGGSNDDAGVAIDAAPPPRVDAAPPGAGFGEICEEDATCESRLCYRPDPTMPGHCSDTCNGDCPDGYTCRAVRVDNGLEMRICVPAEDTFCETCQTHAQCGDDSDACVRLGAGDFCTISCGIDPTVCPAGFRCEVVSGQDDLAIRQCMPINGECCIDGDGDRRGTGGGCLAADCDDGNPVVHEGGHEICDSFDNDCDGNVDNDPSDCAAPSCDLTTDGYVERAAEPCNGTACVEQPPMSCGLYTCAGGGDAGDVCATSCAGTGGADDDTRCVADAHCDTAACLADVVDGGTCDEATDCESGHCEGGICCAEGNCCRQPEDCPGFGQQESNCNDQATCQGTRGEAVCTTSFTCSNTGTAQDDSDCGPTTEASDCGLYRPVFCTGGVNQTPPACPTSCDEHSDCDDNAWCDPVSDTCVADLDDGAACGSDDERCTGDHCQNGFCCATGDCCATASNCPGSYSSPPVCTSPTACDGEADVATCIASMCGTAENIDDDSACGPTTRASDCGYYPPVYCNGSSTQPEPVCLSECTSDSECDGNAYCNPQGQCVPDQPDGGVCQDAGECQSAHCENGFCCQSGFCCAGSNDCNAFDQPSVCNTPSSCQGSRLEGVCSPTFQCGTGSVDDDSGCAGIVASDCGPYPSESCTAAPNQPPPVCDMTCTDDNQCDPSAHCDDGMCVPDSGPGGYCDEASDCGGGGFCVDNVCCNSACNGGCEACDLPGSEGACTPVPSGQDPDNECGQVSCVGFFAGYAGDECRRKADVGANIASCNGARACRTQAQECTDQLQPGPTVSTCHGQCQDPTPGTCTGTTPGACNNVNPGTQSCGTGQCARTAPICVNGAPGACTPGQAQTESCNDLDDNCDGTADNGDFSDIYEPNVSCDTGTELGALGSDENATQSGTIYGSGDHDFYKIRMTETDNGCGCGLPNDIFDEDYLVTFELTVPVGGGSYVVCFRDNDGCGFEASECMEVGAGTTGRLEQWFDGRCVPFAPSDSYDVRVEIRGDNAPAFECRPYTLKYTFDAGHCRN